MMFPALVIFQNLPVCVGVGVKQDVRLIEQFYGTIVGYPLKIKFMELGVLAHIAGWQMRGFSLSSLSVQVTGTILNRCVDAGDEKRVTRNGDRNGSILLDQ